MFRTVSQIPSAPWVPKYRPIILVRLGLGTSQEASSSSGYRRRERRATLVCGHSSLRSSFGGGSGPLPGKPEVSSMAANFSYDLARLLATGRVHGGMSTTVANLSEIIHCSPPLRRRGRLFLHSLDRCQRLRRWPMAAATPCAGRPSHHMRARGGCDSSLVVPGVPGLHTD